MSGGGLLHVLFGFGGRLNRAKYWGALLSVGAINFGISVAYLGTRDPYGGSQDVDWALLALWFAVGLWVALAVNVKRLHDRDRSGWFYLVGFIPIFGSLWLLIECGFLEGTAGPNRFGEDPLQPALAPARRPTQPARSTPVVPSRVPAPSNRGKGVRPPPVPGAQSSSQDSAASSIGRPTTGGDAEAVERCESCRAELRPGLAFCTKCGQSVAPAEPRVPMAKFCAKCGHDFTGSAEFCVECGEPRRPSAVRESTAGKPTAGSPAEEAIEVVETGPTQGSPMLVDPLVNAGGEGPDVVEAEQDRDAPVVGETLVSTAEPDVAVSQPVAEEGLHQDDLPTAGPPRSSVTLDVAPPPADEADDSPSDPTASSVVSEGTTGPVAGCENCGAELSPDAWFCQHCGKPTARS